MKFDDLYNKVFVKEQEIPEAPEEKTEVADPADFDDVEPLPLPDVPAETDALATPAPQMAGGTTLSDYISQLEDFANKLNSTDGGSLQALVSSLDRKDTPFEGIYGRSSLDILSAAKTLREVAETLKNFIIHAAKK